MPLPICCGTQNVHIWLRLQFLVRLLPIILQIDPSWLRPKSVSKSTAKSPREFSAFDRETAEDMQAELDRMELPSSIRRRLKLQCPFFLLPFPCP
ncbi:hypothetical protein HPP92_028274 [Vanilla planifolia]|uniref:Uncharacterized protein n=1 Tax=Vanilla planifolia TaxID=51239 RepID=A0A835U4J6_VANPL|nr:hypothetical protein HPP92_028274 [Vanilla planifolia]